MYFGISFIETTYESNSTISCFCGVGDSGSGRGGIFLKAILENTEKIIIKH